MLNARLFHGLTKSIISRSKSFYNVVPPLRVTGHILLFGFALLLASCADKISVQPTVGASALGFFHGLWHGFTILFSFFGSIIWDDIAIYAANNNGGWYNFGFVTGVSFGVLPFTLLLLEILIPIILMRSSANDGLE